MLEIVYGPDWKALSRSARARIVRDAEQSKSGQVLIVPEQYSFEAERALCAEGGDQISRYAEVLSFSRLAERACVRCGGVARPVLDQGGRIMALAKTVSDLRPRLQFYARSACRADFLLQMLSIVDELKCYRVDSRTLAEVSDRLDGTLAVKTQELALLLEGYEAQCAGAGLDPRDRLEQLLEHISRNGFGRELRLLVDGFFGFTALELQILGAFLAQGVSLTVFLCCDGLDSREDPDTGNQVFSCVRSTMLDLMREADLCGAEVRMTRLEAPLPPLSAAALSAFTREAAPMSAGLRLYRCPSPREEAEAVCADILQHVRSGGRFRDITVACASSEALRPILEEAFARCQIPAFFAGKQPALRTPLLNSTLCALRAAGGRMEREDVIACLRSDGAPITQAECDLLENYAFLWNISGERWNSRWTWHPRGYDNGLEESDRQLLETLNALRQRCIEPLWRLRTQLRACATVGDCVIAFYDFLHDTSFSANISSHLDELERAGEVQQAQLTRQLYELLINALEQLYGVQYDVQCSPEEFLRLMEILLGQYQVGAIPAVLDAVTVGESAALEHRQTKLLFLCGCTDGCFPKSAGGVSLLTEPERRRLRAAGVGLAPDENEQMDRNLLGSYALMCAAEDRLTLSAGDQSAWLFTTLCRLYPDAVAERSDAPSTAFATARTLGLRLAGGAQMDGAPREAEEYCLRLRAAAAYDFGPLSAESIRGMYGEKLFLSASRIDRHAACRFHFFLYDGLKARERKAASFDAPIYGTFVHDVLEKTVRRVMAEGGFHQTEKSRVREIAKTHMDEFLSNMVDPALLSSGRFSYLMNRNYDEVLRVVDVLCDELRDSAFAPADCELQFGYGGALPPVQVSTPEGQAVVAGAVDRVDVAEIGGQTYYRVVDYKTGRKKFDFTDLLERRGLQMLIYLFALEQSGTERYGGPLRPAGVLYVPAHDDMQRFPDRPEDDAKIDGERRKSHRRQGLLLNDEAVLQAMEPCGASQPELLPYKQGKNGPTGNLMDAGQLRHLRSYVGSALRSVTEEIRSGNVRPNPYTQGDTGACTWCPYASVCHLDLCSSEPRVLRATGAEEFWTRLAEKEAQNG